MVRRLNKPGTQVSLNTQVDRRYLEALREIKKKTNWMVADLVREAVALYVADKVRCGLITLDPRYLPFEDWSGLARRVGEVLQTYSARASESVRLHGRGEEFGADPTEALAADLRAALERYEQVKMRVAGPRLMAAGMEEGEAQTTGRRG